MACRVRSVHLLHFVRLLRRGASSGARFVCPAFPEVLVLIILVFLLHIVRRTLFIRFLRIFAHVPSILHSVIEPL